MIVCKNLRNFRRMDNILREENQLHFFRLFLIGQGDKHVDALDFWKACEDAKAISDTDERNALVSAIKEKFLLGSRTYGFLGGRGGGQGRRGCSGMEGGEAGGGGGGGRRGGGAGG